MNIIEPYIEYHMNNKILKSVLSIIDIPQYHYDPNKWHDMEKGCKYVAASSIYMAIQARIRSDILIYGGIGEYTDMAIAIWNKAIIFALEFSHQNRIAYTDITIQCS